MDGVGRGPQDVIGQLVIELGGSLGVLLTAVGDETERARKTVTARIRDVLRRIERVHPALPSISARACTPVCTADTAPPPRPAGGCDHRCTGLAAPGRRLESRRHRRCDAATVALRRPQRRHP